MTTPEQTRPAPDEERSIGRRAADHRAHARRRLFDRLLPVIVACMVVLLIVDTVLSVAVFSANGELRRQNKALGEQGRQLRTAIGGSCHRLQRVRDDLNANEWNDRLNSLQSASNASAVAGVLERFAGQTPLLRSLEQPFRQSARAFVERAGTAKYLPPTDCRAAVRQPGTFRAPRPIPFRLVLPCYDPKSAPRPEGPCPTR